MSKAIAKLSRRNVVVGGATAATVGAIALSPLGVPITREARELIATQPWARGMLSLSSAGYDQWLAQVGSVFALGGGTTMRLAGVRPMASEGARPMGVARRSAFVAMFDMLGGQTVAGDLIYTVSHSQYGPLQIFLSASTDPRTPGRVLAVFN